MSTTDFTRDDVKRALRAQYVDSAARSSATYDDVATSLEIARQFQANEPDGVPNAAWRARVCAKPAEALSMATAASIEAAHERARREREKVLADETDALVAERFRYEDDPELSVRANAERRAEREDTLRRSTSTLTTAIKRAAEKRPDLYTEAGRVERESQAIAAARAEHSHYVRAIMGEDPVPRAAPDAARATRSLLGLAGEMIARHPRRSAVLAKTAARSLRFTDHAPEVVALGAEILAAYQRSGRTIDVHDPRGELTQAQRATLLAHTTFIMGERGPVWLASIMGHSGVKP